MSEMVIISVLHFDVLYLHTKSLDVTLCNYMQYSTEVGNKIQNADY